MLIDTTVVINSEIFYLDTTFSESDALNFKYEF